MAEESAEQVRERHVRDMGPQLGDVYHLLWKEVPWLHAKWNQYRQLYAHSRERVEFLNKVGGHFFGIVQHTLRDDILLHLARLTDPPKSNRLTLQRLPKLAPEPALRKEFGSSGLQGLRIREVIAQPAYCTHGFRARAGSFF
jgi:AbiU2